MRNARVDVSEEPLEMPMPTLVDDKSRFLKRRTKIKADNDYHPSYDQSSCAEIPEMVKEEKTDEDLDVCVLHRPEKEVSDEDIGRLKRSLSHMSFDVVLRVLALNKYDVDATIEMGRQMVVPDLVPEYVKDIIVANVAVERNINPTKGITYKDFYFAKDLDKVVNTKALVNFYYKEKNKKHGNWRIERPEKEMTAEEKQDLEERMKKGNISIVTRDSSVPRQTRGQRAAATRRLRRHANDVLENGDSAEPDSDNVSVSSLAGNSESDKSDDSMPTPPVTRSMDLSLLATPSTPTAISNDKSVGTSPISRASSSSSTTTSSAASTSTPTGNGRKRRRKSADEKHTGPRRSYPDRKRRPPSFFE